MTDTTNAPRYAPGAYCSACCTAGRGSVAGCPHAPPEPAPAPDADGLQRFCPERKAVCETPAECAGRESGCKMQIRMNIAPPAPCCGEWFTCDKPCSPRADRWRDARNDELRTANTLRALIEQQAREGWRKECDDVDDLCELLGLRSDLYRTDGGSLNLPRIKTALRERHKQQARELASALAGYKEQGERAAQADSDLDALAEKLRAAEADAERYRTIRDNMNSTTVRDILFVNHTTEAVDAAIDAARAKAAP